MTKRNNNKKRMFWTVVQFTVSIAAMIVVVWFGIIDNKEEINADSIKDDWPTLQERIDTETIKYEVITRNTDAGDPETVYRIRGIDLIALRLERFDFGLFFIGVFVYFISMLIASVQWFLLLRFSKIKVTLWDGIRYYFIGLFFNNVLPGSIGGDLVKGVMLGRKKHHGETIAAGIIVDRVFHFCSLGLILIVVSCLLYWDTPVVEKWSVLIFGIAAMTCIGGIVYLIGPSKKWFMALAGLLKKGKLKSVVIKFIQSMYLFRKKRFLAQIGLMSLASQGVRILMNYLVARALFIQSIELRSFFFVIPIVGFTSAPPISVNGIGVREFIGKSVLTHFGISEVNGILIMFISHVALVFVSLLGGLLLLYKEKNAR